MVTWPHPAAAGLALSLSALIRCVDCRAHLHFIRAEAINIGVCRHVDCGAALS